MSRNIRSRLTKLEKSSPARGDHWSVVVYCPPGEADRLHLAALEILLSRGYQPDRHQLRMYFIPDNGRPHPGKPQPPVRVHRYT